LGFKLTNPHHENTLFYKILYRALDLDGEKYDGMVRTEFIWLRIETGRRLL
jgi:hypothetical protein